MKSRKVVDLVGRELRSKGKRCAELWRRHCRAGSRSAAQAAFHQAVTYGFVPAEILEELETLGRSVEAAIPIIEHACLAKLDGAVERRARLYMASDAIAYVIGLVRSQVGGGTLAAAGA